MKNKIFIFILFITISSHNFAQVTIYTPKGDPINASQPTEAFTTDSIKIAFSNWIANLYPNAVEVNAPSATSTYNCHGYAWHVSEGGDPVWIGTTLNPDESVTLDWVDYWEKGSYMQVLESTASNNKGKVYYPAGHSGIYTGDGDVISKWGSGPLMRHAPGYGPDGRGGIDDSDYDMGNMNSYIINPEITGSQAILCEDAQRTFSEQSITHLNVGYSWSKSSKLTYVYGQGSENYTVKGGPNPGGGQRLILTVTTPSGGTGTTMSDDFWVGVPDCQTDGFAIEGGYYGYDSPFPCIYWYDYRRYGVQINKCMEGADYHVWEGIVYPNSLDEYNFWATFIPTDPGPPDYGSGELMVRGVNACGCSAPVAVGYGSCGYSLYLTPNPAIDETTLVIKSIGRIGEDIDTEWDMEIYTETQVLKQKYTKIKGQSYKINTQGWKEGVYIFRIRYKDQVLNSKLIVRK